MSFRYPAGLITASSPVNANYPSGVWTPRQALPYLQNNVWGQDPFFDQTVLLLHGDGTNGAQNNTFLDSSSNNFTITRNGNTTQGTFTPFSLAAGEWSNYFDGTGDGLSVPANAAFDFGSGNFTVEAWVYLAGNSPLDGNSRRIANIFSVTTSSVFNFNFIIFGNSTTTGTGLEIYNGSNIVNVAGTINQNTWNHVAVSKSGTSVYFWLNGTQLGSTQTTSGNWGSSVNGAQVGRTLVPSYTFDLNGYISNVRVLKGTALYTAAFTPPTTPLTAITNTSLLTCQSNRFVDNSTNNFAITRNGDVRVTPFSPFQPLLAYSPGVTGGSGYFDGSGDYLSLTRNTAFIPTTGDFTVEAWVYVSALQSSQIAGLLESGTAADWSFQLFNNGTITFFIGSNVQSYFSTATYVLGQWNHVMVCRSGSTLYLGVNGVANSTTATASLNNSRSYPLTIGADQDGDEAVFTGYISGLRFVNGSAVYPSTTYTVPTAPPTAITNTSLLCNFTNAGILDNTAKNVLETVGNAQIDTAVVKYGTGAMEFAPGQTNPLVIPHSELFSLNSGDFTIEAWVYLNSDRTFNFIISKGGATTREWGVNVGPTNIRFYWSTNGLSTGDSTVSGSASLPLSTWMHIAVTRSGNSIRLFKDGTQVGSTGTFTSMYSGTSPVYVGRFMDFNSISHDLDGFIDDLRITKGIARYTANFVPPVARFPNQ